MLTPHLNERLSKSLRTTLPGILFFCGVLLAGCGKNGNGGAINIGSNGTDGSVANVVVAWNNVNLTAVRTLQQCRPGFTTPATCVKPFPTVVSRTLAITQTCVFDAWAAYDDKAKATVLGAALRRPAGERTLEIKIRPSALRPTDAYLICFLTRYSASDRKC